MRQKNEITYLLFKYFLPKLSIPHCLLNVFDSNYLMAIKIGKNSEIFKNFIIAFCKNSILIFKIFFEFSIVKQNLLKTCAVINDLKRIFR